jgi:hypothetical protein
MMDLGGGGTSSQLSFVPGWRPHQVQVFRSERARQFIDRHDRRVTPPSFKTANVLLAEA